MRYSLWQREIYHILFIEASRSSLDIQKPNFIARFDKKLFWCVLNHIFQYFIELLWKFYNRKLRP